MPRPTGRHSSTAALSRPQTSAAWVQPGGLWNECAFWEEPEEQTLRAAKENMLCTEPSLPFSKLTHCVLHSIIYQSVNNSLPYRCSLLAATARLSLIDANQAHYVRFMLLHFRYCGSNSDKVWKLHLPPLSINFVMEIQKINISVYVAFITCEAPHIDSCSSLHLITPCFFNAHFRVRITEESHHMQMIQ